MKTNIVSYKSFIPDVTKEIRKENRENLKAACIFARDSIKEVLDERRKSNPGQPPGKLSGRLQKSITYAVKDDEGLIGTNDFRASMLELGTEKMKARPFFVVTLERISGTLKEIMAKRREL